MGFWDHQKDQVKTRVTTGGVDPRAPGHVGPEVRADRFLTTDAFVAAAPFLLSLAQLNVNAGMMPSRWALIRRKRTSLRGQDEV